MLITKEVEILLTNRNIKKTINRYNLKKTLMVGDIVWIPICKIPYKSHFLVKASCDYCNREIEMPYSSYNRRIEVVNKISCSNKLCSNRKIKDVCISKYGVENVFQSEEIKLKSKKTNLEKYGVEYASMSDSFKDNLKKSNLSKWGVENVFQSDEIKKSIKNTIVEKYGVYNVFQSDEIKKLIKNTLIEKYGVDHPLKSESILYNLKLTNLERWGVENVEHSEHIRKNYKISKGIGYIKYLVSSKSLFSCDEGHNFEIDISNYHNRLKSNTPLCTICYPIGDSVSIKEKELYEFILSIYSGEIIQSYRDGLEMDIYLPDMKIGFEFNGLFWHSEKHKDKNYHLKKTKYFQDKGIRVIHVWEDDWTHKREILESQIKNMLKITSERIFARKCYVQEIKSAKIVGDFLNKNHIQGKVTSSIRLGLYSGDELVSVMTFDSFEGRKRMENGEYNLNRFCNKLNTTVIGGASKLLDYFIKKYDAKRIISYSDNSWSIGNLYLKLGFKMISEIKPDYKYILNSRRRHKQNFKKSNLNISNSIITENKYMSELGYYKIYDCGKIKFELCIFEI